MIDFINMRVQRSATIRVEASIEAVFPLFGPIREKEWAYGWDPETIYPKDVLVAKHMVFRTYSNEPFVWVIVNYEPDRHMIEYMVTANERFWFITVNCVNSTSTTLATITYSYTALTSGAHEKNQAALSGMFASDLKDWEEALNHYVKTGKQLTS